MKKPISIALVMAAMALPVAADEVEDTLQSALQAYKEGDVQYALEELAYAQQLLNAMKSNALQQFLPEAPDGWTREDDPDAASGYAAMGGTGSAARYSNGNESFSLMLLTDSPMVMGMANIFGNSAVMAAQGKLVKVGREKFIAQDDHQLMGIIDGRIMVQAEGAPTDLMLPILELIDFRNLGRFGL